MNQSGVINWPKQRPSASTACLEAHRLPTGIELPNSRGGPAEGLHGAGQGLGRGFKGGLYLPAGDVVFDAVRVLEAEVLDREPVLEVAYHPAGGLADGDLCANAWPLVGCNGTTGLRNV